MNRLDSIKIGNFAIFIEDGSYCVVTEVKHNEIELESADSCIFCLPEEIKIISTRDILKRLEKTERGLNQVLSIIEQFLHEDGNHIPYDHVKHALIGLIEETLNEDTP